MTSADHDGELVITPELMSAYEATLYEVKMPRGTVTLRIGQPSTAALEKAGHNSERMAVVTAFNPFSRTPSAAENLERQERLQQEVTACGRQWFAAAGRDPSGQWPAEPSLAILDPSDNELDDWMLAFGQNAIVIADVGENVRLRQHPHEVSRIALDRWTAQRSAARLWARAWSSYDPVLVTQALHPNVIYESQWVFSPMEGRDAVADYIRGKMQTVQKVAADPATRLLVKTGVTTAGSLPGKPCVVMFQGQDESPATVILFELKQGLIARVDVCIPQIYAPRLLDDQDEQFGQDAVPG